MIIVNRYRGLPSSMTVGMRLLDILVYAHDYIILYAINMPKQKLAKLGKKTGSNIVTY